MHILSRDKSGKIYGWRSPLEIPAEHTELTSAEIESVLNGVAAQVTAEEERGWRDSELVRADIELLKVQDGVGTGTVAAWRSYRIQLRDWPTSPDFPDATKRPVAPDA